MEKWENVKIRKNGIYTFLKCGAQALFETSSTDNAVNFERKMKNVKSFIPLYELLFGFFSLGASKIGALKLNQMK